MSALTQPNGDPTLPVPVVDPSTAPKAAPGPRFPRPRLSLVPRPVRRRAARTPFAVLVLLIAGIGLVGLLAVNTHLQQGALEQSQLEEHNQQLRERRAALAQAIDELEAPATLAQRASAHGMVPNPTPLFLQLSDGAVLGVMPDAQGTQQ